MANCGLHSCRNLGDQIGFEQRAKRYAILRCPMDDNRHLNAVSFDSATVTPARLESRSGSGKRQRLLSSSICLLSLHALTLLAVATLVFLLPRLMPGHPLSSLEDPDNSAYVADPELRPRLLAYYGLDRSWPAQYGHYIKSLAQGDLGWSISRKIPVTELIRAHLPWTLFLMFLSLALASAISFVAGLESAWRRGQGLDRWSLVIMTAIRAVPEYVTAALLLIGFAVVIPLFPLYGARTPFAIYDSPLNEFGDIAYHLILPVAALTMSLLGTKFLLVRNTVVSVLGEDYLLLARAKGLPDRLLKYRHAGRNALLPFLTIVGIQAAFAAGGSVFVETVFAYPGMGMLILKAVETRDYPVIEASFLVLAAVVILVNLMVDLLYGRLDPRTEAT